MDDTINRVSSNQEDKNEQAEEDKRLQELKVKEIGELQEPNFESDKPLEVSEQGQENKPQSLNYQTEESSELSVPDLEEIKIQDLSELVDENKPAYLIEQAEESSELMESDVEYNKTQELAKEQNQKNKPQRPDEQMLYLPDEEPSLYPLARIPEIYWAEMQEGLQISSASQPDLNKIPEFYLAELQEELDILSAPPPDLERIPDFYSAELPGGLQIPSAPQPDLDKHRISQDWAKDGRLPDLKEEDEETSKVLIETLIQEPQDKKIKPPSITTIVDLKPQSKKKQKDTISYVSARSTYSMRTVQNLPVPGKVPLQRPPSPKVKPETVDKGTQCKLMLMRKLKVLPRTPPPQKRHVLRAPTADKSTQINSNYGRLEKRSPVLSKKKKTGEATIGKSVPSKTRSSTLRKESDSSYDNISMEDCMTVKKDKKAKATYNFHITVYEGEKEMDSMCKPGPRWEESESSSGLSKACTVLSTLKSGKIHTSDLLLTLHTLGILVTNAEMCRNLRHVKVNASGTLDFSEFLEVVNNTSPFTDTEDFQTILWVFKKIHNGMVAIDDLESVLAGLGVNLNNEEIQQTLGCTEVRYGNVDILNFLQTAWGLQKCCEEDFQSECDAIDVNPFQDVTELVSADATWRKKYSDDEFDQCLVPLMSLSCPNKDIVFAPPQRRLSWRSCPGTVISTNNAKVGDKGSGTKRTKSQSDATDLRTTRSTSVHNTEGGDKDHDTMEVTEAQTGAIGQTNAIPEEE